MKDDVYRYNHERWESLARANALFTRPRLDFTPETARAYLRLEQLGIDRDLAGKKVLCLAGGGGQQSAAFALLGAEVSVFDISESQLNRDKAAARHYNVNIDVYQGDMRDLSIFATETFDIVWHPYSLTFVPDCRIVFREVSRILKRGGLYSFMCSNPFYTGMTENDWNGKGYSLRLPYEDGLEIAYPDQEWVYAGASGDNIQPPREYRQTLSRILNGLIDEGFVLSRLLEVKSDAPDTEPGSWGHFTNVAPPWLSFVWHYLPGIPDDKSR